MLGKILNVNFAQALSGRKKRSAIKLSAQVSYNCLNDANLPVKQLQALLNTGIYRDNHTGEPAIAALIHGDIQKKFTRAKSVKDNDKFFCFDISNGGSGPLNAVQISCGLIESGKLDNALIVSSDALPRRKDWRSYPFGSHAFALLLEKSQSSGFKSFFNKSYPEFIGDYSAELQWTQRKKGKRKHHLLSFEVADNYLSNCLSCAKETILDFLKENDKKISDFDLMLTNHSPTGFTRGLKESMDFLENFLIEPSFRKEIHTAGIGKSLNLAWENGVFKRARNILFLTVGAGIQVSMAWYQNNELYE